MTLPAVRRALAHAAAGGSAHLLAIGPAEGTLAVHTYGKVGQVRPGRNDNEIDATMH